MHIRPRSHNEAARQGRALARELVTSTPGVTPESAEFWVAVHGAAVLADREIAETFYSALRNEVEVHKKRIEDFVYAKWTTEEIRPVPLTPEEMEEIVQFLQETNRE